MIAQDNSLAGSSATSQIFLSVGPLQPSLGYLVQLWSHTFKCVPEENLERDFLKYSYGPLQTQIRPPQHPQCMSSARCLPLLISAPAYMVSKFEGVDLNIVFCRMSKTKDRLRDLYQNLLPVEMWGLDVSVFRFKVKKWLVADLDKGVPRDEQGLGKHPTNNLYTTWQHMCSAFDEVHSNDRRQRNAVRYFVQSRGFSVRVEYFRRNVYRMLGTSGVKVGYFRDTRIVVLPLSYTRV